MDTPVPGLRDATQGPASAPSSYREILRSSLIVGSSSAINLAISLIRTKLVAMLLGPSGIGLMGALTTIIDLARGVSGLGVTNSGVRQIAEADSRGDTRAMAQTVSVLRSATLALGVLGAITLWLLAEPVSQLTFGGAGQAAAVAMVAAAVFFRLVSDGQLSLLQGTRRIGDIAKANVFSALFAAGVTVALLAWLGEQGIAMALVAATAATMLVSWHYSHRIGIETPVDAAPLERRHELGRLLRTGLAFMLSAMATLAAAYVVRLVVIRNEGLDAAGYYQAAWAVGQLFVGFVLQAMGTDFYPRLVGAASDDARCNRLVNEQALVSMVIAATGVVGTIVIAPWLLTALYSNQFSAAAETLRWIALGMVMRVATWPLGYVLIAKGKNRLFVGVDVMWSVANVALTIILVKRYGASGAGMAFFAAYVLHLIVLYPICRSLTGFRWTKQCAVTGVCLLTLAVGAHIAHLSLPTFWANIAGGGAFLVSVVWSLLMLRRLAPHLPIRIRRWITFKNHS